ncbi:hypothetical protein [Methylocystis parvus]|uniref:Uncharacterized protein n=1 Tax=Methylocystis parvus TaxID=134 RepID=A0A6B8LZK4_9HYPH|nr:hypothetical protein [Methylocystis parvus]QGM96894.1 hypothetical protein F7D14_05000 [Methylocystis parvus]WBJ99222.1 hypothetical protein MMG94_14620 [Methylocystis parvus OBBP]
MTRAKSPADIVSRPSADLAALPAPVRAIRDKILAALETNDVEALRIPVDWNEVRPLFAKSGTFRAGTDPIEILKATSFDGKGRETISVFRAVLAQPYVTILRGPVTLYEWPAFARADAPPANEEDAQARWRCVRFADLPRSNAERKPRATRLGVASDGVWHYFWSED